MKYWKSCAFVNSKYWQILHWQILQLAKSIAILKIMFIYYYSKYITSISISISVSTVCNYFLNLKIRCNLLRANVPNSNTFTIFLHLLLSYEENFFHVQFYNFTQLSFLPPLHIFPPKYFHNYCKRIHTKPMQHSWRYLHNYLRKYKTHFVFTSFFDLFFVSGVSQVSYFINWVSHVT